jgi:hypothetical protein
MLAAVVRLGVFGWAENKQGDAPMRVLIAERMNADPAAARDARSFCQFGPLPIEVIRPFLRLDPDPRRASRWPSLVAGLAVLPWLFALGRRLLERPSVEPAPPRAAAEPAVLLAGLALALSPLHVQASTTASSEALYLLLSVGAYERLAAAVQTRRLRDVVVAGGLAALVAITRFDAWISVPVAGAALAWWGGRDARALGRATLYLAVAAILPVAYLAWSWRDSGDPFFFARYIARDHAALAGAVRARLGGGGARARQLGIWAAAFAAVMSPALAIAGARALATGGGWRRLAAPARVVVAAALAPTALYVAKGLALGDFEPLPRFAIAPGVIVLPLAAARLIAARGVRAAAGRVVLGALAVGGLALALGFGPVMLEAARAAGRGAAPGEVGRPGGGAVGRAPPRRIWGGAESIGPLTRLDAEDRALADHLRAHRRPDEAVFLDTAGYGDITVAHAAGIPIGRVATLTTTRTPAPTLAQTRAWTGATWFAYHDRSWGRSLPPDWPATAVPVEPAQGREIREAREARGIEEVRIGGWHVVRLADPDPAARPRSP